jgi:hypothetical protein
MRSPELKVELNITATTAIQLTSLEDENPPGVETPPAWRRSGRLLPADFPHETKL